MKESSLLMRPALTALTRSGDKTQTRRTNGLARINRYPDDWIFDAFRGDLAHFKNKQQFREFVKSPYGRRGDLIYLKEPHYLYGEWKIDGKTKTGRDKWRFCRLSDECRFLPWDHSLEGILYPKGFKALGWHKRSPLFMAKRDARTWVKIVSIGLGRLQDISHEDAICEGYRDGWNKPFGHEKSILQPSPLAWFVNLWNSINGPGSWDANPWVSVITYRLLEADELPVL